jgi:hypothetical protein
MIRAHFLQPGTVCQTAPELLSLRLRPCVFIQMFIQPKLNPSVYDGSSHAEILFRCCTDTEGDVCVCVCVSWLSHSSEHTIR